MGSHNDLDDDEYVAKLLAEDAKKSSMKYASMGLSALLPKRPINSAPKPNTRFLQGIIRETDNHNAALKKKEELEARIRLRKLREENDNTRSSRGLGDQRGTKRRRLSDDDRDRWHRNYLRGEGRLSNTSSERSRSRDRKHHRSSRLRKSPPASGEESERYRQITGDRRRRRSRSVEGRDSRQPANLDDGGKYSRQWQRRRSRSASKSESGDLGSRKARLTGNRKSHRESARSRSRSKNDRISHNPSTKSRKRQDANDEDKAIHRRFSRSASSDPLEALVGPIPAEKSMVEDPPPVRPRGRGAYRSSGAAMDAHFSNNYDPKLDLHPESEAEDEKQDWDMALEALRDREMWKQKHAERLREAGFGDAEIKKWEDIGKEKDAEDVQWNKRGEAREWDVGKVAQDESEKPRSNGLEEGWKRKGGGFLKTFKEALG